MVNSTLSEFPGDWRVFRIGEIADVKGGKRLPKGKSLAATPTSHPYIRVTDFRDGRVEAGGLLYVPEDVFPAIKRYTISKDDVYISIVGTIGLVGIVGEALDGANLTENAAKICRIRPNVDRDFIAYYLRSSQGQAEIRAQTVGSTQPKLALFRIKDIPVALPHLPEQRTIAHILGTLDDKIELNRQMNHTLEAIARALFRSWFVDFDPVWAKANGEQPYGMDAATAALFPDAFVDSELGPIPEGWQIRLLGEVASVNRHSIARDYPYSQIEYIDISSVTEGKLAGTTAYHISESPSRARRLVTHGDTIWSTVRPNRKSYLFIHSPAENLVVSTGFAVLSPALVPASYLYSWATTEQFVSYLVSNTTGSAYPAVRAQRFEEAQMLVPPTEVLRRQDGLVAPMRDLIAHNDRESETLAELRDTLLPKLISGELRVPEVNGFVREAEGTLTAQEDSK